MTNKTKLFGLPLLIMGLFVFIASSCDKDDVNDVDNGTKEIKGELIDADDNVYTTVTIGGNEWTAENLRVTRYSNGDEIPRVQDAEEWVKLTTGAWCYYDNNPENEELYGKLYNWHAVNDERGLAPEGWRVPTNEDWINLVDFAGGERIAGGKLKSTRTAPDGHPRWDDPNSGATDEYGFSALPGGLRNGGDGEFLALGGRGYWWSSTLKDAATALHSYSMNNMKYMSYEYSISKRTGISVRCVKN
ncbi:MAG: fibrobacter succinogenes major paralogous domain-containing protein [Bacteroidetes bacterium]|nr:fibrobacter succinogenes major paralogous domain-containing protein [Bacteroidota bacterium]